MTLTPGAAAWAAILATLVDPRTSDEDLEEAVDQLKEDAVRSMLVALAAMHAGYIEEEASRRGLDMAQMMRRVHRTIRENTEASERIRREESQ